MILEKVEPKQTHETRRCEALTDADEACLAQSMMCTEWQSA